MGRRERSVAEHRLRPVRESEPKPCAGDVHVWVVDLAARGAAVDYDNLDPEERRRAAAFKNDHLRARYALAHVALRQLLAAYLGDSPAGLTISRRSCAVCGAPHGKPALAGDAASRLYFNLAHSGEHALVAVARSEVGVDIEQVASAGVNPQTVSAALAPAEARWLATFPFEKRDRAFFSCWTRKEAYLKARGVGLNVEPREISIPPPDRDATVEIQAGGSVWLVRDVETVEGYAAAVAVEGRLMNVVVSRFGRGKLGVTSFPLTLRL